MSQITRPRRTREERQRVQARDQQQRALYDFSRGEWRVYCPNGLAHGRTDGGPRILVPSLAACCGWYSERRR